MKTHDDVRWKYKQETGANDIYRKTSNNTLVYDEEYVHWLEKTMLANGVEKIKANLNIGVVIKSVCFKKNCIQQKDDKCLKGNYNCMYRITDL